MSPEHQTYHDQTIDQVLAQTESSIKTGLHESQVKQKKADYGLNRLREAPREPWFVQLMRQFKSIVIFVLILAALLSGLIGEWLETWTILAIVVLNGLLGFFQEARADKALASLKAMSAPNARVIREGIQKLIPAVELVPGDLIELEAGDFIPADCRLVTSYSLRTQEAPLTGESEPVDKDCHLVAPTPAPLAERRNMIFSGTTALSGKASAIVTATGMETEIGKIAGLLAQQEREPTPLQRRLAELGKALMILCLVVVALVAAIQWFRGGELAEIFIFAVSLAVAAVPEGLPAIVTITLAFGLTRMARRNALIRRLPSVETLGSVTIICSDKTGTLTRNEMTVKRLIVGDEDFRLEGSGYDPSGVFRKTQSGDQVSIENHPDAIKALRIGALCNHSKVMQSDSGWQVIGDPTEGALIVSAMKAHIPLDDPDLEVVYENPFDADRKMMSMSLNESGGKMIIYAKGAPEAILSRCVTFLHHGEKLPLSDEVRQKIASSGQLMAGDALRVLGLAFRDMGSDEVKGEAFEEEGLTFVGLAGMIDPPRSEAKVAVKKCRDAGIRPVMITGDHPATGFAIAKELGIAAEGDRVVTGAELDQITDEELKNLVPEVPVYARVSPAHKLRVVKAWKNRDQIVAMTGDGVNDAPAVKMANIGISMGITGTDVTKEASAMVLTDDNFASIVNAVEEGRGVFSNIQNIMRFLLAGNSGEILLVLIAVLIGWPTPMLAMQILWINLITDGFPALALATEPPEKGIMGQKPRPVHEPIFTPQRALTILKHGALLSSVSLFGYWWMLFKDVDYAGNVHQAQAVAFCICAFSQLAYSFSCRSGRFSFFELGVFGNVSLLVGAGISMILQLSTIFVPWVQPFFFEEAPDFNLRIWGMIGFLSFIPATLVEGSKLLKNRTTLA